MTELLKVPTQLWEGMRKGWWKRKSKGRGRGVLGIDSLEDEMIAWTQERLTFILLIHSTIHFIHLFRGRWRDALYSPRVKVAYTLPQPGFVAVVFTSWGRFPLALFGRTKDYKTNLLKQQGKKIQFHLASL